MKRDSKKEAFIAQEYGLGERLEYDFGDVKLVINGIVGKYNMEKDKEGNDITTAYKDLIKRNHWKIGNSLYHVLDDLFREDRSPARKSKNNLAVIRKIAYNILRIAIIQENRESGPTEMLDQFNDDLTQLKNIYSETLCISDELNVSYF